MAAVALVPKENALDRLPAADTRAEILARYRRVREINKQLHDEMLERLSRHSTLHQARRLGLVHGKTLVLDSIDEMAFVFDLAIYTAPTDRSRAIDRYARAARLQAGSEDARVLEAMRHARFSVWRIERRHQAAGLILKDLLREAEVWLVDEGLERTVRDGEALATRLFTPDAFSVTCGVMMPVNREILEDVFDEVLPRLSRYTPERIADDRRFAEAIYRTAIAYGVMDEIGFLDVPPPGG